MGIYLESTDGQDLKLNAWNWGVLHRIVEAAGLFPEEVWAPKRWNGGGELDRAQVERLATFLETRVLPALQDGERLLLDGTITAVPDDGTFYRDEAEQWRNYGLRRDVVAELVAFLRNSQGPINFL